MSQSFYLSLSTGFSPFLMYFCKAKLPLHVQMEGSLGAASAAPIEQFHLAENIMRILMFSSNYRSHIVLKQQRICPACAQGRQKRQYDLKHSTSSRILKVGDKVLKVK